MESFMANPIGRGTISVSTLYNNVQGCAEIVQIALDRASEPKGTPFALQKQTAETVAHTMVIRGWLYEKSNGPGNGYIGEQTQKLLNSFCSFTEESERTQKTVVDYIIHLLGCTPGCKSDFPFEKLELITALFGYRLTKLGEESPPICKSCTTKISGKLTRDEVIRRLEADEPSSQTARTSPSSEDSKTESKRN
jgi:hypothetical protein